MPQLKTLLNPRNKAFQDNVAAMTALVKDLQEKVAQVAGGGNKQARQSHQQQGKLLARERITALCDPDSDFLELSPLAAYRVYSETIMGTGLITGIGCIHDQECMIIANDVTVNAGIYYPLTIKKHLRAQEIAAQNNLPCVYLLDSISPALTQQDQVFADRDGFGRIIYNQANLSAQGIAQIAVVFGMCTASNAYLATLVDELIMVKDQASIFLADPSLVKAATGEMVNEQALGGAEIHCQKSGVADYYANTEIHALEMARTCIANLNYVKQDTLTRREPHEPKHDPQELYGIISSTQRKPYDIHEIIARLVDASEFTEFKAQYGNTLVCGFAHLAGYPIGIIANNGSLFAESAVKGTHFIELCCQRRIPLVFLQNSRGFMVDSKYEAGGMAKHGAKLVTAVACANVPKFTIIIGDSIGTGNYSLCGRAFAPRFLWLWPNARTALMDDEQAAQVLAQTTQDSKENLLASKEDDHAVQSALVQQYAMQSQAYYSSARLWDDGIIDPVATRKVLTLAIAAALNAAIPETQFGLFRM